VKPRLYVLLARNAPVGLVIRRGPAKTSCVIRWDRTKDRFQVGQWMRGRIYERRCDIAPDGLHWIYFVLTGQWGTETKGSYTVLARTPWLRALTLFPEGNTWSGGGLFTGPKEYWVCSGSAPLEKVTRPTPPRIDPIFYPQGGIEDMRLRRDGWVLYEGNYERPLPKGWVLRKTAPGYRKEGHGLLHRERQIWLDLPAWEWADWDNGSLVWAEEGCLYRGPLTSKGPGEPELLYDFGPMKFEAIKAPY